MPHELRSAAHASVLIALLIALLAACGQSSEPFAADRGGERPPDALCSSGPEVIYGFLDEGSLATADAMLDDVWNVNSRFEPAHLPAPLSWTEDPYDENYWRFLFYSLRPTRHLLFAYCETGDERYRDKLVEVLESFAARGADSPYVDDKHTAAFLAMVLVNAYAKLDVLGDLSPALAAELRGIIRERGTFLEDEAHFERHNNHGVTQAAALMLIAHHFPDFEEAARWYDLAASRLRLIVAENVAADGVQVEQSPYYHFYVLSFLWQIHAWNQRWDVWDDVHFAGSVEAMVDFAAFVVLPNRHIPLISSSQDYDLTAQLPTLYGEIASQHPEFAYVYSGGVEGRAPSPASRLFETSGWAILRSGFGETVPFADETQVFLDVGPYRTGHSQLDALSLVVYGVGQTVLTDSGLFSYEEGEAHDYYFGTRAHNTVVVDGLDQRRGDAAPGGFIATDEWTWASGRHPLYDGMLHSRGILLLGRDRLLVVDQVAAPDGGDLAASHRFDQLWHFGPQLDVEVDGAGRVIARRSGAAVASLVPAYPAGIETTLVRGAEGPRLGWASERYEVEVPTWTAQLSQEGTRAQLVTLIALGEVAAPPDVAVQALEGEWRIELTEPLPLSVTVVGELGQAETVTVEPL